MTLCKYLGVQHPRYLQLDADELLDWLDHFGDDGEKPAPTWGEYHKLKAKQKEILARRKRNLGF